MFYSVVGTLGGMQRKGMPCAPGRVGLDRGWRIWQMEWGGGKDMMEDISWGACKK